MKKHLLVSFLVLITLQTTYAQWTQIGLDIDGEAAGDESGGNSDISADGLTLAIGALFNDGNGVNSGHVRVFKNQSNNWVQIGADIDGEMAGDSASELSLSGDGLTVAIGSWKNSGNGTKSGHVRVFKYQGSAWVQLGDDLDGKTEFDYFGTKLSISYDGLTMAVSGLNNDTGPDYAGYVRIYKYQSGVWQQVGNEIVGEAEDDYMGLASSGHPVCINADGSIVAIGAVKNDGNGQNAGHVRIFENQSGVWQQIGNDIDGEASGDSFGYSVTLSTDGTLLGVGAPYNDDNGDSAGQVRVFQNQSNNWIQIGNDINGENQDDYFGNALSLSGDGNFLAVGALGNDGNGPDSGHVRVFQNQANHWEQIGADINGEAADDYSGFSVNLSSDASTLAIGAYGNDGNGVDSGHVRVFDNTYLGDSELSMNDIIIYPNPTNGILHFQLLENNSKIYIYDVAGKLMEYKDISTNNNALQIDISSFEKGIYFMKVLSNKNAFRVKKIYKN